MFPSFDRGRVQSRIRRGSRRWRGKIDSSGKNLERDRSQFLLPPRKSIIPVNAKGEVGTEPELPAAFASFPVGAVQHVFGGWSRIQGRRF